MSVTLTLSFFEKTRKEYKCTLNTRELGSITVEDCGTEPVLIAEEKRTKYLRGLPCYLFPAVLIDLELGS